MKHNVKYDQDEQLWWDDNGTYIKFEKTSDAVIILLLNNYQILPGESYYLDPKLVEVVKVNPHPDCLKAHYCTNLIENKNCSQRYNEGLVGSSICNKSYSVARIIEPVEQKESQEELIEEIYHLCNTESYEHVAKLYTITRNPVTK